MAQENGDDERAAGQAQLDGLRAARETDRQGTEDDADHDAQEDGDEVRLVQGAAGIAHLLRHAFNVLLGAHADQGVAHLEEEVRAGNELDAGADDTRHAHFIDAAEMQVLQFLTGQGRLGDREAAGYQMTVHTDPVVHMHRYFLAEEDAEFIHLVLRGDQQDLVSFIQDGLAGREDDFAALHHTGDDEIAPELVQDAIDGLAGFSTATCMRRAWPELSSWDSNFASSLEGSIFRSDLQRMMTKMTPRAPSG